MLDLLRASLILNNTLWFLILRLNELTDGSLLSSLGIACLDCLSVRLRLGLEAWLLGSLVLLALIFEIEHRPLLSFELLFGHLRHSWLGARLRFDLSYLSVLLLLFRFWLTNKLVEWRGLLEWNGFFASVLSRHLLSLFGKDRLLLRGRSSSEIDFHLFTLEALAFGGHIFINT